MKNKIIKKILRGAGAAIVVLLAILLALVLILRSPVAQTNIARIFAGYMTRELGTEVRVDRIRIGPTNVVIRGLYVEDHKKKALIDSKYIKIAPGNFNLVENTFNFREVVVDSTSLNLRTYSGEEKINLDRIIRFFTGEDMDTTASKKQPVTLTCDDIHIIGFRFSLFNEDKAEPTSAIDYSDMDISGIDLDIDDFSINGDTIAAMINTLEAREKSGFELRSFRGDCKVSSTGFTVSSLELVTNNSTLNLDLEFDYYHYQAFTDYINKVEMMATIHPSRLQMADIGYFTETMQVMRNELKLECNFEGTVSDFMADELKFSTGRSMKFHGDVALKGLPDIRSTHVSLDIEYLFANKFDIETFALPIEGVYLEMPGEIATLGDFKLTGKFDGIYNDFTSRARINTAVGSVRTDLKVRYDSKMNDILYDGNFSTRKLNLGRLFETETLGQLTMQAEVNGKGLKPENLDLYVTAWVDTLGFYGNEYNRLVIGGEVTDERFNGRFLLADELGNIEFTGLIDFESERPLVNFRLDVQEAMLNKMNLIDRADDSKISLLADVIIDFESLDDWRGTVRLDTVNYVENGVLYKMDSLKISGAIHPEGPDWLKLECDYADASINGDFTLSDAYPDLKETFLSYVYDSLAESNGERDSYFALTLTLHDARDLTQLFLPSLSVASGSILAGSFIRDENRFSFRFTSDSVEYGTAKFNDLVIHTEPVNSHLDISLDCKRVILREPDPEKEISALGVDSLKAGASLLPGEIDWRLAWDDVSVQDRNWADIEGNVTLPDEGPVIVTVNQLDAVINSKRWGLSKDNEIAVDSGYLAVRNFNLSSDGQEMRVNGTVSNKIADTIDVNFQNWDLAYFNPLIGSGIVRIDGDINGDLKMSGLYSNPSLISDIRVDDFSFNDQYLGELLVQTSWLASDSSLLVRSQIMEEGNISTFKTLDLNGYYYPFRETEIFDFDVGLNNLNLAMAEPFMKGIMSGIKGLATGRLRFSGDMQKPLLTGKLNLMRTEMLIDYLNVEYSLAHDVYFDENIIFMRDAVVYDSEGNRIDADLELRHDYFTDFYLDLELKPEKALALNTNKYANDVFYGTAYASGSVFINGPFDDISMDIQASPTKGTDVTIPIQYSVDVSQSDFIVFTSELEEEEDTSEEYKTQVKGLSLNLDLDVNKDANLQIFLPGDMGFIRAIGNGNIELGIDSRGYFSINGKYSLVDGLFNFNLEQLLSKRFQIREGSSITWNGNVYDAEVNIAAIYRTKTTLAGLGMALPQGSENQRVNVHLYVLLTENLFNPHIRFSIQFPYLQEAVKSNVYAVLDTADNAMMNQQAISLLVLNSFSTPGYSNVSSPINSYSIIANQLSAVLSKISNDFDIGINYIPGDEISREEVEVALSTQLFDNRLIIDGNVDVPTSNSTQNTSNIVGEVNIEYKLTADGRFRVKAFNRSNNLNMLEQYAPYTQGVGLFYRKEFNNIGELFRREEERKRSKDVPQETGEENLD